jgi:hypothetical protein
MNSAHTVKDNMYMMMIVTSSVTLFISIIVMFVQPQHKVWSLVSKKQETTLAKTFQRQASSRAVANLNW